MKEALAFPVGTQDGLTKREYFASAALQAWITKHGLPSTTTGAHVLVVRECYTMADTMLAESDANKADDRLNKLVGMNLHS
jgi:hypothetical protein